MAEITPVKKDAGRKESPDAVVVEKPQFPKKIERRGIREALVIPAESPKLASKKAEKENFFKRVAKKTKIEPPPIKDGLTKQIEGIMEEGLEEIYKEMPESKKIEFKIRGEETSQKIRIMFKKARLTIKKILKLILEWLKIIPGVNKFFLEQEAKIKAEKIIALKRELNKE